MNEEERYLFDLWGYLVIEDVLSKNQLAELNTLIDQQNYPPPDERIETQRFGNCLG